MLIHLILIFYCCLTDELKLLGSLLLGNLFRRLLYGYFPIGLEHRNRWGRGSRRLQHLGEAGNFPLGFPTTGPSLLDLGVEGEGIVFPLAGFGISTLGIALGVEVSRIVTVGLASLDRLCFVVVLIVAHCVNRLTELLLIVKRLFRQSR